MLQRFLMELGFSDYGIYNLKEQTSINECIITLNTYKLKVHIQDFKYY